MSHEPTSIRVPVDQPAVYAGLLAAVKERVRAAQYAALKAVNTELLGLYWDIGRMIAERQAQAGWGRAVVENLSADLRREFPGTAGFSVQNLWYMRQFYVEYHADERLQPLVGEIAWAHNLVIMKAHRRGHVPDHQHLAARPGRATAPARGHSGAAGRN